MLEALFETSFVLTGVHKHRNPTTKLSISELVLLACVKVFDATTGDFKADDLKELLPSLTLADLQAKLTTTANNHPFHDKQIIMNIEALETAGYSATTDDPFTTEIKEIVGPLIHNITNGAWKNTYQRSRSEESNLCRH